MALPQEFIDYTKALFGDERWERYLASYEEDTPVSVRLNPYKVGSDAASIIDNVERGASGAIDILNNKLSEVPWCRNAYYLKERPNFTLDPLLHAGCYYVQEASSMFLDQVLRQYLSTIFNLNNKPIDIVESAPPLGLLSPAKRGRSEAEGVQRLLTVGGGGSTLDLCAAPGGKSTLLRAALPDDCMLFSNEPDRRRANILMENLQKQGHPNVIVTNNYPRDYRRAGTMFDMILADVPCSGEGMFRRDEATIKEWSLQNVMKCAELQRSIIEDIWSSLKPGGILVYSTCTFNLREDEENVRWITEELGAEVLPVKTKPEWNITGSLLEGWDKPVYRFIPGTTKGEGLFMAVLRKTSSDDASSSSKNTMDISNIRSSKALKSLKIMSDGTYSGTIKGKTIIPDHAEALLTNLPSDKYPRVELSLQDALRYLHHEALVLPEETPKGFVIVTYLSHPLGFMKNIGNRANNLYPQEWKIRNI